MEAADFVRHGMETATSEDLKSTQAKAMTASRFRRCKILRIEPQVLVDMLNGLHRYDVLQLPEIPEIPAGTVVVSIRDNYCCRSLDIVLQNDQWPEATEGCELERLNTWLDDRTVWRRKKLTDTHERA